MAPLLTVASDTLSRQDFERADLYRVVLEFPSTSVMDASLSTETMNSRRGMAGSTHEAVTAAGPIYQAGLFNHFHILGSKLHGSGRPTTSFANSRCAGFRRTLRSCGMTADGTDNSSGPAG